MSTTQNKNTSKINWDPKSTIRGSMSAATWSQPFLQATLLPKVTIRLLQREIQSLDQNWGKEARASPFSQGIIKGQGRIVIQILIVWQPLMLEAWEWYIQISLVWPHIITNFICLICQDKPLIFRAWLLQQITGTGLPKEISNIKASEFQYL